jgi:flagellar M-ring protein FliF
MKNGIMDTARALGARAWTSFRAFSAGQKAVTVAAALGLVVGAFMLLSWHSSPTYAPLFTNLAPADASSIVDKLNSDGVPYQLSAAGTEVLVPQSQVYSERIALSAAGLPNSSQTGYSLLDKEGVTTSQFQQQVDYQRAIEGELGKTIQSISGVNAATVHLAIPQQDVFNDGSQKPTAAVMLTTAPGTTLNSSQVQSVVYLVSSSVPGMSADNVTVSDSAGNVLAAPGSGITSLTGANTQSQLTQTYDNQVATQLQAMLDKAIGPGNAMVNVNAALDFSKTSTTQRTYIYSNKAPPVSKQTSTEKYTGTGQIPGGTAGADTTGTSGGGKGKYINKTATVNPALGTKSVTTDAPPGQVKNLAVAVLLNKSVKGLNVNAISSLVKSGVGFSTTRGDTLSVQAIPFNTAALKAQTAAATAAQTAAASSAAHAHLMSMIKQGALGLLIVGLAVGTWFASRKRRAAAPEPNDDVLGLDEFDLAPHPTTVAPTLTADFNDANTRRRVLADVVDNRPADAARVLSGWLNTKES